MSFNPNIPLGTDPTLQSYFQLRANFQAINEAFADNHAALNGDQSVAGKHSLLTLTPTTDPTTSATEIAIYNKLVSGVPELFFMPSNSLTPIQMTYPSISTGLASENPDVYLTKQYTFIAGPFIIYGGFISAPTNGQVVTLTPGTTLLYVDVISANVKSGLLFTAMTTPTSVNTPANSFTISYSNGITGTGNLDVYYFAIGV